MADNTKVRGHGRSRTERAVVVMEADGQWAAALRRQLAGDSCRVVETRSRAECLKTVAGRPACFVVVEIDAADADRGLRLLADLDEMFGRSPVVAVARDDGSRHQWLARQLGAVHFVTNARSLRQVTPLIRRHFARQPAADRGLTTQIISDLPWGQ